MNEKIKTVKLPSAEEVNLGLKVIGSQSKTLNLETDQSNVVLNSSSKIKSKLEIKVPSKVETFTIQSLSLGPTDLDDDECPISVKTENKTPVILNVRNLTTEPNSSPYVENLKIDGQLNIQPNSNIVFGENTTVETADISYRVDTFDSIVNNALIKIENEINNRPRKLKINPPENVFNISQVQSLTLVQGLFNCDDWRGIVDFPSQYFSGTNCSEVETESSRMLADDEEENTKIEHELVLLKNEEYHNYDNDPKVVEKKVSNLSGGAIAGIVIAVIVVVVGLMIGEFFLVKHLLNKDRNPSEKEAEEV